MRCENCGETFAPEDIVFHRESHGFTDGFAETLSCCPFCGSSDLIDTEACDVCGKEFPDGEIESGYCLDCLWNSIDYDTALVYIKSDRYGGLAQFILNDWFGANFEEGAIQGGSSNALDAFLEETFRRLVADEKLRCAMCKLEEARFLEACRSYCLPHYSSGNFGVEGEQFAEWYARRKREGKAT